MEIICEIKLVKVLTADVDHHRHITIVGGILSYSYSQYEHSNRLGNNLLRTRPVCTCATSLNPATINVICFSVLCEYGTCTDMQIGRIYKYKHVSKL
jgi:hypothetical protein